MLKKFKYCLKMAIAVIVTVAFMFTILGYAVYQEQVKQELIMGEVYK